MLRAICSEHPDYFREKVSVAPPTFLTTMFFWEAGIDNANPWSKVKMDIDSIRVSLDVFLPPLHEPRGTP